MVYQPGIPGQEGESSSVQLEGMVYLEIASPNPPDTLWLTYWEHLLSDAPEVTPGLTLPLVGDKGTFFEGSSATQVFYWNIPENIEQGYFSMVYGNSELAKQWAFSAGDRVRIRVDLKKGNILFGGPTADFYRTQYLMDQAFSEEKFNSDPILIASRSEGLFTDSASGSAYRKAHSQPQDIHVRMKVLVPKENGWDYLTAYLQTDLPEHPAWTVLDSRRQLLTVNEFNLLESRMMGEILWTAGKRAELIAEQLAEDQEKGSLLMDWADGLDLKHFKNSHPKLIQGITLLEVLRARIQDTNIFDQLVKYPFPLRDELLGYFLLSNYNRFKENLDSYLLAGIGEIKTLWIKSRLTYLHQVQLGPFVSEGLYNTEGSKIDLSKFEGKTLLLHFWISGCKFCKDDYERTLKPLETLLEGREDIVILTVNADAGKSTWKNSLGTGNYTSAEMLNLYAEKGVGVLDRYKIHSFPQKMIIGPDSKIRLQTLDKMGSRQLELLLNRIQHNTYLTNSSTQLQ